MNADAYPPTVTTTQIPPLIAKQKQRAARKHHGYKQQNRLAA